MPDAPTGIQSLIGSSGCDEGRRHMKSQCDKPASLLPALRVPPFIILKNAAGEVDIPPLAFALGSPELASQSL